MIDCICIDWGYAPEMGPYRKGHHPRCSLNEDSREQVVARNLKRFDGTYPQCGKVLKIVEPQPPGSKG